MKQTTKRIVWLVAFLGINTIGQCTEPFAKGTYLGQIPPGSTAQVFAPGLISDTRPQVWESHGTFSADGNTFCYLRCSVRHSPRVGGIFITENTNQGWTAPKLIESIRENVPSVWSPCLSLDANSIYFARGLPASKRNLYRCDRTPHGWAVPQVLGPPLSSPATEWGLSIAANNSCYLCSHRPGGFGGSDIWHAPFINNTWSEAIHIPALNTRYSDGAPGIAPDESFLVFNSVRPGGLGGADLYLSLRQSDGGITSVDLQHSLNFSLSNSATSLGDNPMGCKKLMQVAALRLFDQVYFSTPCRNCDFELKNGSGFRLQGLIAGASYVDLEILL